MHRTVGPDIAVFEAIILAGQNRAVQRLLPPRTVVGMNRIQQILVRKRVVRLAAIERLAGVGRFQLQLRQMQLQRAEVAGVERGLQQALALGEVFENGAGLILPAAAPHRGSDDTHQRSRMKRTLNEGDVAERLPQPRGIGVAFGAAALMGEQHDRKIRP